LWVIVAAVTIAVDVGGEVGQSGEYAVASGRIVAALGDCEEIARVGEPTRRSARMRAGCCQWAGSAVGARVAHSVSSSANTVGAQVGAAMGGVLSGGGGGGTLARGGFGAPDSPSVRRQLLHGQTTLIQGNPWGAVAKGKFGKPGHVHAPL